MSSESDVNAYVDHLRHHYGGQPVFLDFINGIRDGLEVFGTTSEEELIVFRILFESRPTTLEAIETELVNIETLYPACAGAFRKVAEIAYRRNKQAKLEEIPIGEAYREHERRIGLIKT